MVKDSDKTEQDWIKEIRTERLGTTFYLIGCLLCFICAWVLLGTILFDLLSTAAIIMGVLGMFRFVRLHHCALVLMLKFNK